ncbi:PREDICTED: glutamate receptor-like, partial [Rhagoletis zephyria]|uniref:glutamate receptor-like n=1 Tax=Rhagoletis zephyria TaxID=28612 RepID=UPI0008116BA0
MNLYGRVTAVEHDNKVVELPALTPAVHHTALRKTPPQRQPQQNLNHRICCQRWQQQQRNDCSSNTDGKSSGSSSGSNSSNISTWSATKRINMNNNIDNSCSLNTITINTQVSNSNNRWHYQFVRLRFNYAELSVVLNYIKVTTSNSDMCPKLRGPTSFLFYQRRTCPVYGLLRLQQIYQGLKPGNESFQVEMVKRIANITMAIDFLHTLEDLGRFNNKYIVLDCPTEMAKQILIQHVRDISLGRRTYHYLLSGLVMDDRWESEIIEFGAINITGFRIVDTNRRFVHDFLDNWKRLDPATSMGAGRESISAQAALMYDAVFVLVEAFNKILRKKPDQFRNNIQRRGQQTLMAAASTSINGTMGMTGGGNAGGMGSGIGGSGIGGGGGGGGIGPGGGSG